MMKKYDLLMLNFIIILIFIVIVRAISPPYEDSGYSPILGNFMIFMLYAGIPLLGLVAGFYFINYSWVWSVIILCEIMLAWPCGSAILYWAEPRNEMYTWLSMTAPIFLIPGIIASLLIYYILRTFIAKNDKTKYVFNIILHLLSYTLVLTFVVLYVLRV